MNQPDQREVASILASMILCSRTAALPARIETAGPATPTHDDDEQAILAYLENHGAGSPLEIGLALGLARATLARKLAHLSRLGLLISHGNTRATRYQLAHGDN